MGTSGKAEDLKGKSICIGQREQPCGRCYIVSSNFYSFFSSIVHVFKELGLGRGLWVGLVVGILIAISITSGMCAVMIITGKPWAAWTTMVKVLSVEWLILVINVVMLWLFSGAPWMPY